MTRESTEHDEVRLLLVEDNFLIGLDLKARLSRLGYVVEGPIPSIARANRALEERDYDIAVLDMNIMDGTALPIAVMLQERGCPFVFLTGYAIVDDLPESMLDTRILTKPLDDASLAQALREAERPEEPPSISS